MKKIIPAFFIVTLVATLTIACSDANNYSSSLNDPSFVDKLDSFSKDDDQEVTYKSALEVEYFNNTYEVIYRYTDKNYSGYFIAKNNEVEFFYDGKYIPQKSDPIEKIIPLFSNIYTTSFDGGFLSNRPKYNPNETDILGTPIGLISDEQLFTETDETQNTAYLIDVPEYFNYPDSPVVNGCAPVSAAMLLSFFDRYSSLTDLIEGELPLNHEEDSTAINSFITDLSILMKTNNGYEGTYNKDMEDGITTYLESKGYSDYRGYTFLNYRLYTYLISECKNPAIVNLYIPNQELTHFALGIGYSNDQQGGNYMITHMNYNASGYLGNYYVNTKYFISATYIGLKNENTK